MTEVNILDQEQNSYKEFLKAILSMDESQRRSGKSYTIIEVLIQIALETGKKVELFTEDSAMMNVRSAIHTIRQSVDSVIDNYRKQAINITVFLS